MQIFRFDAQVGKIIRTYDSHGAVVTNIFRMGAASSAVCIRLEPGGMVGMHPAGDAQLFLVVQGEGLVCSGSGARLSIRAGEAAFWQAGELHETTSETGLEAIVLEGPDLDPARWMALREEE